MTDLSNLTTRQKSALLCKAMGWRHEGGLLRYPDGQTVWGHEQSDCTYGDGQWLDLYEPQHMALAWRVLLWAPTTLPRPELLQFFDWRENSQLTQQPAARAQQMWLDAVLELVIDAGLVELEADAA